MVDHDGQLRKPLGEDGDVVEMAREDDGDLEDDTSFLEQVEGFEDAWAEDPVGIGFVVDEVPDPAEARVTLELVEPRARPGRLVEW
jgi:hypothetical protein